MSWLIKLFNKEIKQEKAISNVLKYKLVRKEYFMEETAIDVEITIKNTNEKISFTKKGILFEHSNYDLVDLYTGNIVSDYDCKDRYKFTKRKLRDYYQIPQVDLSKLAKFYYVTKDEKTYVIPTSEILYLVHSSEYKTGKKLLVTYDDIVKIDDGQQDY